MNRHCRVLIGRVGISWWPHTSALMPHEKKKKIIMAFVPLAWSMFHVKSASAA